MSSGKGGGSAPVLLNPSEFLEPLKFLPFPNVLQPYIAALILQTFLYGLYSVLFSICMYILIRRRQFIHWVYAVLTSVMFSLATADICYTMHLHFNRVLMGTLAFHDIRPKYWFFVINNVLADCTILYRCYMVWGGDWRIMTLPSLLLTASMIYGFIVEGSSSIFTVYTKGWIYIVLSFTLNVILTGLTAGRIWWSWRGNRILYRGSQKRSPVTVAFATVIESGLLAAVYLISEYFVLSIILDNSIVQVIGIVPTLIVVQVGLGHTFNPVKESSERTPVQRTRNHVVSFFSNKETATVGSKGDHSSLRLSSGSYPLVDQLRTVGGGLSIEKGVEKHTNMV